MSIELTKDLLKGKVKINDVREEAGVSHYKFVAKTKSVFGENYKEYIVESTSPKEAKIIVGEHVRNAGRGLIGFEVLSIDLID